MGFFATYEAPPRDDALTSEEKDILVAEGTIVAITAVSGPSETKNGPALFVDFDVDGETKVGIFSLGSVRTRDHLLLAVQDALAAGEEPVEVVFRKSGRAYILENPQAPSGVDG